VSSPETVVGPVILAIVAAPLKVTLPLIVERVADAARRSVEDTVPKTWTRLNVEEAVRTVPEDIHLNGSSDPVPSPVEVEYLFPCPSRRFPDTIM